MPLSSICSFYRVLIFLFFVVYAFGVTLWEILTGEDPYSGLDTFTVGNFACMEINEID